MLGEGAEHCLYACPPQLADVIQDVFSSVVLVVAAAVVHGQEVLVAVPVLGGVMVGQAVEDDIVGAHKAA